MQSVTGIEPEHQRLVYGTKPLANGKKLRDYNVKDGGNLHLALRLPGGGGNSSKPKQPKKSEKSTSGPLKCMITQEETTHTMPCGHPISTEGLMGYCRNMLGRKEFEFKCPHESGCEEVWTLETLKQLGTLNNTEINELETDIGRNYLLQCVQIRECPNCNSQCERQDSSSMSVTCVLCTQQGKSNAMFCWQCLNAWKNNPSAKSCGNEHCSTVISEKLKLLKESKKKKDEYITGLELYELRACPKCSILIEHKEGCKEMTCENCKQTFCFRCLKLGMKNVLPCGQFNVRCELAPIQTTLSHTPTQVQ